MSASLRALTLALLLPLGSVTLAQTEAPATAPAAAPAATLAGAQPTVSPLRPAVAGERYSLDLPGFGKVNVYADLRGTGRPLVLTHSVNAAASAYEMKPIWDAYAGTRPLYALEWPGFGSSDRPDLRYTPELMTRALLLLVGQIGQDADVVSLSLGSEFAARAALQEPRIRTLALISPSGLGNPRGTTQQASVSDGGQQLYGTLNAVGTPLYALLRTRLSIELFLAASFRGLVDTGLVNYALDTSGQPGAKYAPLYFISGGLFTPDAYTDLYSKLNIPTLVLYDRDAFVSFERLPLFVGGAQNRSAVRIADTDGLPHFEKMPEVKAALDAFWQK